MNLWIARMAWRESRRQRVRLLLLGCSMMLGVAALAAIGSIRHNIQTSLEEQARGLVGGDLVLISGQPFTQAQETLFRSLGGVQARETRFKSMAYSEASGASRPVIACVVSGDFPLYGRFETTPSDAEQEFAAGRGALVDQCLLLQLEAKPGGEILVGDMRLRIVGSLDRAPGQNPDDSDFSTAFPLVYVEENGHRVKLDLKPGGFVLYRAFFRFPAGRDANELVRAVYGSRLGSETVADRKQRLGRWFADMDDFMSLIALIALALGGLGISTALSVHLREKKTTVAVLRCLGCSFQKAAAIYVVQGLALGAAAAAGGLVLAVVAQAGLPRVLAAFLPARLHVEFAVQWAALLQSAGYGAGLAAVFGLLPLLEIRTATPLAAIRRPFEQRREKPPDRATIAVWLAISIALVVFSVLHSARGGLGTWMALALLIVLVLLAGLARALVWLARRLNTRWLPFPVRQGLAGLHRPRNRTLLLMVVLGTGAVLLLTAEMVESSLQVEFRAHGVGTRANTLLIDVQGDQVEGVLTLMKEHGVTLIDQAPVVTMRLASLNGVPVEELLREKKFRRMRGLLAQELRASSAVVLRKGEKVKSGSWPPEWNTNDAVVPISLEEALASNLGAGLGDELGFDVQGIPMRTRVAALRQVVDWRAGSDFFAIFPPGALDDAPAVHVFAARLESAWQSAAFQKDLVRRFPNISVNDWRAMQEAWESMRGKVEDAARFISGFTILMVIIVMAGALATSRAQRIRESALLRTLGASKRQLLQILAVEYAALGAVAGLAGSLLSLATAWGFCHYLIRIRFIPDWTALPRVWPGMAVLATLTGLLGAGKVMDRPPLEVLRSEE